jgi:hypothetical protein
MGTAPVLNADAGASAVTNSYAYFNTNATPTLTLSSNVTKVVSGGFMNLIGILSNSRKADSNFPLSN